MQTNLEAHPNKAGTSSLQSWAELGSEPHGIHTCLSLQSSSGPSHKQSCSKTSTPQHTSTPQSSDWPLPPASPGTPCNTRLDPGSTKAESSPQLTRRNKPQIIYTTHDTHFTSWTKQLATQPSGNLGKRPPQQPSQNRHRSRAPLNQHFAITQIQAEGWESPLCTTRNCHKNHGMSETGWRTTSTALSFQNSTCALQHQIFFTWKSLHSNFKCSKHGRFLSSGQDLEQ